MFWTGAYNFSGWDIQCFGLGHTISYNFSGWDIECFGLGHTIFRAGTYNVLDWDIQFFGLTMFRTGTHSNDLDVFGAPLQAFPVQKTKLYWPRQVQYKATENSATAILRDVGVILYCHYTRSNTVLL
jgi:hypothetical protein